MTTLTGKYEQVDLGDYVVNNNCWNTDEPQTIETTENGFKITRADGSVPLNGGPKSYPSIYKGVHYGRRSRKTQMPVHVDTDYFSSLAVEVEIDVPEKFEGTVDGRLPAYDAALDVWFDPTPRFTGQNTGAELMVWLDRHGAIQPIGSKVREFQIGEDFFDVWFGNIGWNVVSYVPPTGYHKSIRFALRDFYDDMLSRGYASKDWYLTSVQMGFEPWVGGTGLAVTKFTVGEYMLPRRVDPSSPISPYRPVDFDPDESATERPS